MKKEAVSDVVFPGQVLCAEEEFAPGFFAQGDETGNVIATVLGEAVFDSKRRTVGIEKKTRAVLPLRAGAIMHGKVVLVKDNAAIVEAIFAEHNGVEQAVPNSTIAIPVSRIDMGFVQSARQKFKVGDIVVGVVEKVAPWGIDLNTSYPEFGAIKSFCGKCREPLVLDGHQLKCRECQSVEFRKISSDYSVKD